AKTPVLCIPGLTRNAADFADFAPKAAKTGHDVVTISLRGRGPSDYDPHFLNYRPETYRDDILKVLDAVSAENAIFVGTSLGGIVTMLVNAAAPQRVKGAVLNDVGPDLAPEGIARIAGYVGKTAGPAKDLNEAAARIKAINGVAFPDASEAEWLLFAKRTFRETQDGWVLDYDLNIARALAEGGPAPDLWPAFESLKGTPTLVIRGALSDLLTPPIVDKMREVHPNFELVEVPRIGHAPMLTEPAAWGAIAAFLDIIE
ncbi:MAG: alpha/beta fold hydrolase, partial [Hyphococcus sp.]